MNLISGSSASKYQLLTFKRSMKIKQNNKKKKKTRLDSSTETILKNNLTCAVYIFTQEGTQLNAFPNTGEACNSIAESAMQLHAGLSLARRAGICDTCHAIMTILQNSSLAASQTAKGIDYREFIQLQAL